MTSRFLILTVLLAAASLPHCMRVTDGIEVDVAYQPEATPAAIRTDVGYRVRLDRAFIVVGKVELLRCDNFVRDLWHLVVPAMARAHELTSPTSLGVPFVLDLMEGAGTPQLAGTLRPPPGKYCSIRITGMPADEDAEGLHEENLDMMSHTALASGEVEDTTSGEREPLLARVWEVLDCEMELERPLDLGSPVLERVSIRIDHTRWFDGIDFALQDSTAVQQQITENIRSSLRAVLPDAEEPP